MLFMFQNEEHLLMELKQTFSGRCHAVTSLPWVCDFCVTRIQLCQLFGILKVTYQLFYRAALIIKENAG